MIDGVKTVVSEILHTPHPFYRVYVTDCPWHVYVICSDKNSYQITDDVCFYEDWTPSSLFNKDAPSMKDIDGMAKMAIKKLKLMNNYNKTFIQ